MTRNRPSSSHSTPSRRFGVRHLATAAAVGLALVAGLRANSSRTAPPPRRAAHQDVAVEAVTPASTAGPSQVAPSPSGTAWQPPEARFTLDAWAEEESVCVNDPVIVHATARDLGPQPLDLKVVIGAQMGRVATLSFPVAGEQSVVVQAKSGSGEGVEKTLRIEVRDCGKERDFASISAERTSGIDRFSFVARAFSRGCGRPDAGAFHQACNEEAGTTYTWSFGDGKEATTREAYVTHEYERLDPDQNETSFPVRVKIASKRGAVEGVTVVHVRNYAYEAKKFGGVVAPRTVVGPTVRAGDAFSAPVELRSYEERPFSLAKADITVEPCGDQEARKYTVGAEEVLDTVSVGPGTSQAHLTLRGNLARPGDCRAIVKLTGSSADGMPVDVLLGMTIDAPPSSVLTEEVAEGDPEVRKEIDRLEKALVLLGRERGATITTAELRELQQRGVLE